MRKPDPLPDVEGRVSLFPFHSHSSLTREVQMAGPETFLEALATRGVYAKTGISSARDRHAHFMQLLVLLLLNPGRPDLLGILINQFGCRRNLDGQFVQLVSQLAALRGGESPVFAGGIMLPLQASKNPVPPIDKTDKANPVLVIQPARLLLGHNPSHRAHVWIGNP
jgi:hypothetical protein